MAHFCALIYSSKINLVCFQYLSEKVGSQKGSQLDDDFIELEKVINSFLFVQTLCLIKGTRAYKPRPKLARSKNPEAKSNLSYKTVLLNIKFQCSTVIFGYFQHNCFIFDDSYLKLAY